MRLTIEHFKSNDPNHYCVVLITDCASVCKTQNLSCKIAFPESQAFTNTGVTTLQESRQNKKGKIIKIDFLE